MKRSCCPSLVRRVLVSVFGAAALACASLHAADAPKITPPKTILGFNIGDDYKMMNYTQISALWQKWATESNRMKLVNIGLTAEGRPQYMAIISSPANLAKLDHYRDIAKKLAMAEGLNDESARKLATEGKAVVWIDGGMHASESQHSQALSDFVHHMLTKTDVEMMRFLDDVILLAVNANPDGVEVVANWYMREEDDKAKTFVGLPRMYHKYIGHDNNRDFFMSSMPETTNINRVLYREWYPQIMVNHHQTGPEGQVVFIPPFRDPFNYNLDPMVVIGIERLGSAMHERLISEGKGGSSMRSGANYSTWWNGGGRTTPYFHNQIGILTEIIGAPTPTPLEFAPAKQLPKSDWPLPAKPQMWHYRQSMEYSLTMNRAIMDYASRNRENLLFNIYRMGANSIQRGSADNWTTTPKRIQAVVEAAAKLGEKVDLSVRGDMSPGGLSGSTVPMDLYEKVLQDPANRDPRGFIVPANQADFPTAVKFIHALQKNGVAIHKATAEFTVAGKKYPAGSYIVKTAQAYRPFVMDMFEPQDHPSDFAYPGGPPIPPYDTAGWTLLNQMGVTADRVYESFDGPFVKVETVLEPAPAAKITGVAKPAGYLISHKLNDSAIVTNRLLKAGAEVYWLKEEQTVDGVALGTGTIWVPASATALPILEKAAKDLGVGAIGVATKPVGESLKLKPIRIGLVDLYGGVMPSGWVRWLLEQYEFNFEMVYPQVLDAGDLKKSFDVIVFPSQTFAQGSRGGDMNRIMARLNKYVGMGMAGGGGGSYSPPADRVPEEFRSMLGTISQAKTVPPLKTFVEQGGTIVGLGSSAVMGDAMGLPVKNQLVEKNDNGEEVALPRTKYYIPGGILRAAIDNTNPVAYGMPKDGMIFFDNSPVFSLVPGSSVKTNAFVTFTEDKPLYSGWAVGEQYLKGGSVATEASLGNGKIVLLGLEATFRATTHGTFKLFFNSLYYGSATSTK
ncbi:M14 family metallopeptidase [Oleiharenicola lentus]|uniref:M14 family metallopeptidase n=1 Tax=Oleiharenicola lentus TaxID=2508720 RepID=UPI003F678504